MGSTSGLLLAKDVITSMAENGRSGDEKALELLRALFRTPYEIGILSRNYDFCFEKALELLPLGKEPLGSLAIHVVWNSSRTKDLGNFLKVDGFFCYQSTKTKLFLTRLDITTMVENGRKEDPAPDALKRLRVLLSPDERSIISEWFKWSELL